MGSCGINTVHSNMPALTRCLWLSSCAQWRANFSRRGKRMERKGSALEPKIEIIWPSMLRKPCCFFRRITLLTSAVSSVLEGPSVCSEGELEGVLEKIVGLT